jgi:glycine/D-amino acid oxidase-like deaminating enzyme
MHAVSRGHPSHAGVVGLAVAKSLAESGREVIVLEAAQAIGTGTSSRNSEVVHAGEGLSALPPSSAKSWQAVQIVGCNPHASMRCKRQACMQW